MHPYLFYPSNLFRSSFSPRLASVLTLIMVLFAVEGSLFYGFSLGLDPRQGLWLALAAGTGQGLGMLALWWARPREIQALLTTCFVVMNIGILLLVPFACINLGLRALSPSDALPPLVPRIQVLCDSALMLFFHHRRCRAQGLPTRVTLLWFAVLQISGRLLFHAFDLQI